MRALLSVYDKEGLVELAQGLSDLGWELVASGNTSAKLSGAGIAHIEVAEVTGSPEMLGGRVKTLHPKIHGGILADRSKPEHLADLEANGIDAIDLVVSNLYPFSSDPSIELIDIGGPTMVRAAAKNHEHVGIVTSPDDYPAVLEELRASGSLSAATRRRLARAAFAHTAAYDAAIVAWLDAGGPTPVPDLEGATEADAEEAALSAVLPPTLHLTLERTEVLRYGENPHQRGSRYRIAGDASWWDDMVQHARQPAVVPQPLRRRRRLAAGPRAGGRRRARPARGHHQARQPVRRRRGRRPRARPTSARSSATCRAPSAAWWPSAATSPPRWPTPSPPVRRPTSSSPSSYTPEALEKLTSRRKATRLLSGPAPEQAVAPAAQPRRQRAGAGRRRLRLARAREWRTVTRRQPTEDEWRDLVLAWRVCGRTTSNAIAVVTNGQAVGVGAGQQSRVVAAEIAVQKAGERAKGGAGASDAFFPFPDGLLVLADAGVTAVVQPGGSVQRRRGDRRRRRGGPGHGRDRRAALPALMGAILLDGEAVAARIRAEVADRVARLHGEGIDVGLGTVLVGDDVPSERYVALKHEDCAGIGMYSVGEHLPATATQAEVHGRHRPFQRRPAGQRVPGAAAAAGRASTRSAPCWPSTPTRTSTGCTR